jgi:hypothetical protein
MIVLEFITMLAEGTRTPHPEDFIFSGSAAAKDAIAGIVSAVQRPETVTIKWDGSPAIVFGRRTADGRFTLNYKEYIAMPGGQVTSAEELLKFYQGHGKNMEVGEKLASVFNAVGSICPAGFAGFVQGDLMWSEPLEPVGGKFVFRPNPHGVTYGVDAKSDLGKSIAGRGVGLAVHSHGTDIEASKTGPLVNRQSLNGLGGLSGTNSHITVFTGNMGQTFQVKEPTAAKNAAIRAVDEFIAKGGDEFLNGVTQSTRDRLQQYYNRKATGQEADGNWLQSKLTRPQFNIVIAKENKPILQALDKVYMAITQLKSAMLTQLDSQVPAIEQSVAGVPKGEGFNIDTPSGFIKLVDRSVFSTANTQGRL